jgi:hypothetical protein
MVEIPTEKWPDLKRRDIEPVPSQGKRFAHILGIVAHPASGTSPPQLRWSFDLFGGSAPFGALTKTSVASTKS